MNEIGEKYLPIGTVVMLKGGTKRLMITGFCSMATEDKSIMYDYSGCLSPEGILSSDQTALFNHDQIEKVLFVGFVDEDEKKFKEQLNVIINEMQKKTSVETTETKTTELEIKEENLADIPPIGPGLPGYVAPNPKPVEDGIKMELPEISNNKTLVEGLQFDENGVVIADFKFDDEK